MQRLQSTMGEFYNVTLWLHHVQNLLDFSDKKKKQEEDFKAFRPSRPFGILVQLDS